MCQNHELRKALPRHQNAPREKSGVLRFATALAFVRTWILDLDT
jgi:hypothetical protein